MLLHYIAKSHIIIELEELWDIVEESIRAITFANFLVFHVPNEPCLLYSCTKSYSDWRYFLSSASEQKFTYETELFLSCVILRRIQFLLFLVPKFG